jgi:hypothetical protein
LFFTVDHLLKKQMLILSSTPASQADDHTLRGPLLRQQVRYLAAGCTWWTH